MVVTVTDRTPKPEKPIGFEKAVNTFGRAENVGYINYSFAASSQECQRYKILARFAIYIPGLKLSSGL